MDTPRAANPLAGSRKVGGGSIPLAPSTRVWRHSMRNVVIGTAGHVDHGKTALVRRLTGTDTDRLPEEKARGMSIDIGVAAHTLPSGRTFDIVDVPGHERFIRNMVCGVSGIDAAMLVVAADDGPMPQTEEHLEILGLLGVRRGLVVISKIDLVDDELLALAIDETKSAVAGTSLDGAPIVCVSSRTGQGIDELDRQLDEICGHATERDDTSAFRLPVDRVLSVPGAGTVVTGTVAAGTIRVGDTVQLYPGETTARLRGLQSRGGDVESAVAGDRVGLNLHGIETGAVGRGTNIAAPGSLVATHLVNVRLAHLGHSARPLANRQRVHIYVGTAEAIGRVVLMERELLLPGETGLAQLRLEHRLSPAPGEPFVLRSLSPLATIGGGVVLETATRKYRPRHAASAETPALLAAVDSGGRAEAASKILADAGLGGCGTQGLSEKLALTGAAASELLKLLVKAGTAVEPAPGAFVAKTAFDEFKERIAGAVERRHCARPFELTMPAEEIKASVARDVPRETWNRALAELSDESRVVIKGSHVGRPGYVPRLSEKQLAAIGLIADVCARAGMQPVWPREDICTVVRTAAERDILTLVQFMISRGDLVRLGTGAVMAADRFADAAEAVAGWIEKHESISLAQARDLLGVSRHPAQAILEHLDKTAVTRRIDDVRVLSESRRQAVP